MLPILREFRQAPLATDLLGRVMRALEQPHGGPREIAFFLQAHPEVFSLLSRKLHATGDLRDPEVTAEVLLRQVPMADVVRALSLQVHGELSRLRLKRYQGHSDRVWCESLGAAVAMEFMAHEVGYDPVNAFVQGILHGLGLYLVDRLLENIRPDVPPPDRHDFVRAAQKERDLVRFDHAMAGSYLLESWGFPASITVPLRHQLHPLLAGDYRRPASLLFVARRLLPAVIGRMPPLREDFPEGILRAADVRYSDFSLWLPSARAWYRTFLHLWVPLGVSWRESA